VTDTDIDRCFQTAKTLQVFRLGEAADWAGIDETICAEYLDALVQLGLLARTGDLYHPARRRGDNLKLMLVTCLWDETQGIVGDVSVEENIR
jgi:hypothetical protein